MSVRSQERAVRGGERRLSVGAEGEDAGDVG